jgi:hypothetical protein
MAIRPDNLHNYQCADYLDSIFSKYGLWDEASQLWLIEPMGRVEEQSDIGFLQVGRPGVDDIGFGYRRGQPGFWAYYPMESTFSLLADSLDDFLKDWAAGAIAV